MTPANLKATIRKRAGQYAVRKRFDVDTSRQTAILFKCLSDNFAPGTFERISQNQSWLARTDKQHPQVPGYKEMQSSNSSDALLMSVFCHPLIGSWKGVG